MLHVNHTAGGEGEYDLFRGDIDGGDEQLHYGDFFDPPPLVLTENTLEF